MLAPVIHSSERANAANYDQMLLWITFILLGLGMVMVYSASIAIAEADKAVGHQSTYYLIRQAIFIVIGLVAGFISFQIPVTLWQKMAPYLFLLGLFLLILVLIPGVGRNVNGSQRWLSLFVINLQPSELMKLFAAMYVADYAVRKAPQMDSITKGFLPMVAVMVLVGFLLLREPDFGAFAVIAAISISILWLGGINVKIFAGLVALLPVAIYFLIWSSPYRLQRVIGFMDPWADPFGKGYQLSHALIAFGRGEWFGVGLGAKCGEIAVSARSAYRLLVSGNCGRAWLCGRTDGAGFICMDCDSRFWYWQRSSGERALFCRFISAGFGRVDWSARHY